MAWAWGQKLPASQKLTLLAMADVANEPNGFAYWAGLQRLADMQGCSYDQISRNVRDLIAGGYLERVSSGSNRKTKYRLLVDSTALSNQTGGDVADLSNPDSTALSNPIPNTSINSNSSNSNIAARPRNQHWDMLVATFGEPSKDRESLYGKLVQQVKDDDPAQIPKRAEMLAAVHPVVTIESLLKNWSWVVSPAGQAALQKVRMSKTELRDAVSPSKEEEHAEIMRKIKARKQEEP